MRVLFVVPKLSGGGAEKIACVLASELAKTHDVHMISLGQTEGIAYPLSDAVGFEVLPPLVEQEAGRRLRGSVMPGLAKNETYRVRTLARRKRELKCDYAISFLENASFYNVASSGRERTIVSVRNNYLRKLVGGEFGPRYVWKASESIIRADKVVAISEGVRADIVAEWNKDPSSVTTIYNPVDAASIQARSQEEAPADLLSFAQSGRLLVNVARLMSQKGQAHLLRAFARLSRSHPEARLLVLGQGPLEEGLKALASELGISQVVRFGGYLENPFPLIARAEAFVFSSLYEGLGNSLIEAMALGLPVISTDCPHGPRELIAPTTLGVRRDQPGTSVATSNDAAPVVLPAGAFEEAPCGILTPRLDGPDASDAEGQLALAMGRMLDDDAFRLACAKTARDRSRDFAIDVILPQWEELLQSRRRWF